VAGLYATYLVNPFRKRKREGKKLLAAGHIFLFLQKDKRMTPGYILLTSFPLDFLPSLLSLQVERVSRAPLAPFSLLPGGFTGRWGRGRGGRSPFVYATSSSCSLPPVAYGFMPRRLRALTPPSGVWWPVVVLLLLVMHRRSEHGEGASCGVSAK
jgi:hypothetical protein